MDKVYVRRYIEALPWHGCPSPAPLIQPLEGAALVHA